MVKEDNYKPNNTFLERRFAVANAKSQKLSSYEIAKKIKEPSSSRGDDVETREQKYTFGLASMDDKIQEGNLRDAYFTFLNLKNTLNEEKIMPKKKVEKYQEALARRGSRLVNKASESDNYHENNEIIIKYCQKHLKNKSKANSSGLEKAITVISLGSMVFGIAIGYPALTGNAIADIVPGSWVHGAALFFVGLVGVFLANKK